MLRHLFVLTLVIAVSMAAESSRKKTPPLGSSSGRSLSNPSSSRTLATINTVSYGFNINSLLFYAQIFFYYKKGLE